MAEELIAPAAHLSKAEKYKELLPQIEALIAPEDDYIANLANIAAALKFGMGYFWVGFYEVKGEELVLGPFQGPVACTRIPKGKGVCGAAWAKDEAIIVPDVDKFPGHIACSGDSRSEIVIPVRKEGKLRFILDVDSNMLNDFDENDLLYLNKISALLGEKI